MQFLWVLLFCKNYSHIYIFCKGCVNLWAQIYLFFFIQLKSVATVNSMVTAIFSNILFYVPKNKEMNAGLELNKGEQMMTELNFWVNHSF